MEIQSNCFIITSHIEGKLEEIALPSESDYVICADGGYQHASDAGIVPDLVIGDFDSLGSLKSEIPQAVQILELEVEKDETDTSECIKHAVGQGFKSIFVIGGIGGRVDHTIANIQNLARFTRNDVKIIMVDRQNYVICLTDGQVELPKMPGYKISLLSLTDTCEDVSVENVHYPLSNASLTNTFPLGVSNEFEGDSARISVGKGTLMIIMSKDL